MDWPFGMIIVGGAAFSMALARLLRGIRIPPTSSTQSIIGLAVQEAQVRGHRPLTLTHVALAVIAQPSVADELERRGVPLTELYTDLEALLPPRAGSPSALEMPADLSVPVAAFITFNPLTRLSALHMLLRTGPEPLREVFARHGLTSERWPAAVAKSDAPSLEAVADMGPYRRPPASNADTDVVFWNDDKTTMTLVIDTLRGVFGIREPHGTRLALSIDQRGSAVVGTYERDEAERLARAAEKTARDAGFPLRVTTAAAGNATPTTSGLRAWLRRRIA